LLQRKFSAQLKNGLGQKLMSTNKFKLLISVAGVMLSFMSKAQLLTGYIDANQLSSGTAAFTSSSLTLSSSNLITLDTGTFNSLVPQNSDLTAYTGTISGLSSTALADSINGYFMFSTPNSGFGTSGTTPNNRFVFDLATVTEVAYYSPESAVFTGTGTIIDTTGAYANTPGAFNLTFSGPNTFSFSLAAVPEPSTFGILLVGAGALLFRRGKKISG
jgi:hypothetical protein